MEIGIAGLPGAGKTTVFNALAGARTHVGGHAAGATGPSRAVMKVPDRRVDTLAAMFKPKSVKPAEVQFLDVAGLVRGARIESEAAALGQLRTVDALLLVIAAFFEGVTPESILADLRSIEAELLLADLEVVDRRVDRLDREIRMARGTDVERQTKTHEFALLRRLKDGLEREEPLRALELSKEEWWLLRGYGLLSAKPALPILNVRENAEAGSRLLAEVRSRTGRYSPEWLAIPGGLEMELAELDPAEASEFMKVMGIQELSAQRVIQASYRLLDLISFFTVVSNEVRAWPIRRGSTVVDAAGTIHSDMAHGFIRAEVVSYDELVDAGGIPEVRKRGKLRSEGKGYVVKDGDVLNILFHL